MDAEKINKLKEFFGSADMPKGAVLLSDGVTNILNVPNFIDRHVAIVEHYAGKKSATPYLNRLLDLKTILEKQEGCLN